MYPTKSKIEFFKALVSGSKLLANDTKVSVLGVTWVLDASLKLYFVVGIYQEFLTKVKNRSFLEHPCSVDVLPVLAQIRQ